MSYLPGKPIILSRLPAADWFSLDDAARYSGWSRSFIRERIKEGSLAAQEFQKPVEARAKGRGTHLTYRVHIDDLCLFILRHGNGRFTEEKPFRDIAMIVRTWPAWMRRELIKLIERTLSTPSAPDAAPSGHVGQAPPSPASGADPHLN